MPRPIMHLPQPSGCHLLRVLQEDHLAPTNILQGRGGEVSITVELVVSVTIYLAGQALMALLQPFLSLTGMIQQDPDSYFMPPVFHLLP